MTTDTSEKGLETLIMRHMTGTDGLAVVPDRVATSISHGSTRTRAPSMGTIMSPMVSAIGLQTSQASSQPSGSPSSEPTSP